MYNRYFGLKEHPFSISPDPRFLYMSEMHQDALAHLNYGFSADGCIILLTGEVGTGKTTICRCFLEQIDDRTDVAVILNPKLKAIELLSAICDEFQIPVEQNRDSVKSYFDELNRFLLKTHAQNRRSLLIIDEAQNLDKDVLEMVRLLTNLETSKQKLLKIFLLGQSELSDILAQPDMRQISQRVTCRYHLSGLQPADIDRYIKYRITVAGGGQSRQLFDSRAVRKIHQLSGGIPRLINNLCDRSLLGAYAEEKSMINESIIAKAASEVFPHEPESKTVKHFLLLVFIVSIAVFLMVTLWVDSTAEQSNFTSGSILSPKNSQQREIGTAPPDPATSSNVNLIIQPAENTQVAENTLHASKLSEKDSGKIPPEDKPGTPDAESRSENEKTEVHE